MKKLVPIIGLEVHVELATKSKMFCSCPNDREEREPNKNICSVCTGQPGALPVPNKDAIKYTVAVGLALDATIREISKFDRKHYFYPDLPKGYQISQYDEPICENGRLRLTFPLGTNLRDTADIHIRRAHLEEDTAKLFHDDTGATLVDFNRAGTPLLEIVTDPDFRSAEEAKAYCQELQLILRELKVSGANMEKGEMRLEANISVQEVESFDITDGQVVARPSFTLNPKTEVKNLNSFKAVERAIIYEIDRQSRAIEENTPLSQETRGWDEKKGETIPQRKKENAADYRYFPDPDIPPFRPLTLSGEIRKKELPQARRERFREEYGFSYSDAKILADSPEWAAFAEGVMSEILSWVSTLEPTEKAKISETAGDDENTSLIPRLAGGWLTSKLMGAMNERAIDIKLLKISPENFAELIALIATERVNSANAQKILIEMLESNTDTDPSHILEQKGLGQIKDPQKIAGFAENVIRNFPNQVKEYQAGKEPVLKFLVGMAMKASEGTADPKELEIEIKKQLGK